MAEIRIAKKEDAASMLDIYSPFILNSGITQETEIPLRGNFRERIITTLEERPWLVCVIDNEIAGYAYAGKHRERKGYQWCTEPSVYVSQKFYRYGVANALYTALFDLLKLLGYVNAYAVITLPNDKSVAFHERFGFTYLTTFNKIGYKLGQWHDVGWWQKNINEHNLDPDPPLKFSDLNKELIKQILSKAQLLIKNKT